MNHQTDDPREQAQAQIPAVQVLAALGYEVLSPAQAAAMRRPASSSPLLESVLEEQMLRLNSVRTRGKEYPIDPDDARAAIRVLREESPIAELRIANQRIYDHLVLGVAVSKTIDGSTISPQLRFIDWAHPENNCYQVTVEYPAPRSDGAASNRLDVVAFVNGIPFVTIECKRPSESLEQARGQLIRYQRDSESPAHFRYAQVLIAANRQQAEYATVGTAAKFWGVWKHPDTEPDARAENALLLAAVGAELSDESCAALTAAFGDAAVTEVLQGLTGRTASAQDATLLGLCRPDRLLELVRDFTLFDGGVRKIARYQQVFAVRHALERVKAGDPAEPRPGGLVWHTQGSGKSLTMVMLAKALQRDPSISNPRVLLVTDRDDLDRQIRDTFRSCDLEPVRATSGKHLAELIRTGAPLATTIVNKFDGAMAELEKQPAEFDRNLFVLVDEAHRSHTARVGDFGRFAVRMRRALPGAAFIGFTGTPLMKKERSSFRTFGELIHRYTIAEANDDHAVVPLLYEGRIVEQHISGDAADTWFEHYCQGLSVEQQADLKRKFSRANRIAGASQVVRAKALDISEHFRANWQGTGLKAQLVAPNKAAAIRFKQVLDEIGDVTSEVIISGPGEDADEAENSERALVQRFWDVAMSRYGGEAEYNRQVVEAFKGPGGPEILIVVSKLLTGFDAPRNTVLYLCRELHDHTLLQALARVNRLYEPEHETDPKKDFGVIIDYEGMLRELDAALTTYSALAGFYEGDLTRAVVSVREEIERLHERWSAVWQLFEGQPKRDMEGHEQHLALDDLRHTFYARLSEFTSTLHIALSSTRFDEVVSAEQAERYRSDWKYFVDLRRAAQYRYNERVDLRDYEAKIQQLLNQHLTALPAVSHIAPLDLGDPQALAEAVEAEGTSPAAKADRIVNATKRRITEKIDEDPVLYQRFSEMVQHTIDEFRAHRISELEYLERSHGNALAVMSAKRDDDVPVAIRGNEAVIAVYDTIAEIIHRGAPEAPAGVLATAALGLVDIVTSKTAVDMWTDPDIEKALNTEFSMYLWQVVEPELDISIPGADFDELCAQVIKISKARSR